MGHVRPPRVRVHPGHGRPVWITAGLGTDRTVSAEVATRFGRGARFTAERRAASEKPKSEKPTSDNP